MSKRKSNKFAMFSTVISMLLCASMLFGSTFAWFTDSVSNNENIITSGNLDVEMYYGNEASNLTKVDDTTPAIFDYKLWEPGYTDVKYFEIKNVGNLAFKYNLKLEADEAADSVTGKKLSEVIEVYMGTGATSRADINTMTKVGTLSELMADEDGAAYGILLPVDGSTNVTLNASDEAIAETGSVTYCVALKMQESAGNEYQNLSIGDGIAVKLYATQYTYENDSFGNDYDAEAEYADDADTWDGTADTSWYNDTDTEFTIKTAEQLAGFAALVDAGHTFEGKTVKVGKNIDQYLVDANGVRVSFDPIGDASDADFSGIFEGNGHTISNLYQDCNSKHLGLFGAVYEGVVKNLILDNARIENNGTGYAAAIASYAGASTFENITLKNSTVVNYNHNTGGIVGWCSNNGTTTTFDGINIEDTTTIGSWWGSYDTRVGGVVGAMNTGNYVVIKNSTIACKLDVYNDATSNYQWYNYRTAGMVVADVRDTKTVDDRTEANPARVTCENVKVIFDDWANYHYCESASYGTPSYAKPGEYKFKRVEAGLGYGGVDTSACNHAADETHNELIAFDFLFGARDGKGIYGISEFNGVTVVYNNK